MTLVKFALEGQIFLYLSGFWRGDRAVYGGGLENRFRLKTNVGSNPTPSAEEECLLDAIPFLRKFLVP